jgi:hypothetical protein
VTAVGFELDFGLAMVHRISRSRSSSVGIEARLQPGRPRSWGSVLSMGKSLFFITFSPTLTAKLLLVLASTKILGSESPGTNCHILLSDGSGSLRPL